MATDVPDSPLEFHSRTTGFVAAADEITISIHGRELTVLKPPGGKGITWILPSHPVVADSTLGFTSQGLDWTYLIGRNGVKLWSIVNQAKGPKVYSFPYRLEGGALSLALDIQGDLVSDVFRIPRASVTGADGKSYETGAWSLLGEVASFAFDDSGLPAEAFPYVLDPTTTFTVAASADDGYVGKTGPTYPPLGIGQGTTTVDLTSTLVRVIRTYRNTCGPELICPENEITNGLVRWDTSSLPDNAVISGATARLRVWNSYSADLRNLTADWWTGWPIDVTDYSDTAQTGAISGVAISSISSGLRDFSLSGASSNVSRFGSTGLRFHVSGGQATGDNFLYFGAYDHATYPEPALLVTYSVPPTITSASDSPDPVTAGDALTFSLSWSDPDPSDQVKAVICRTNVITIVGTCPGGSWAVGSLSATSPSTAAFTPTAADHGAKTYYAFACDMANACSSSTSGTFTVANRTPEITSATDSPDPVQSESSISFSVGWTDPGDSVRAVICKTNQVSSGACPGGSWGLGTLSTLSPSTASFTPTAADAGTKTYYAFACDAVAACSSSVQGTFEVRERLPAGGVQLLVPETLHSNGADLEWTRYSDLVIPFDKYQVHRSPVASFTPSSATLLTEIHDPDITSYRDTTAAPGQTFTYKMVVIGENTNAQTVTLPAAGKATKLLQPGPSKGVATRITNGGATGCENYGAEATAAVGVTGSATDRLLLTFDVRDLPTDADVESATLQLNHDAVSSATTVDLHAVTSPWREGTGTGTCSGDGATWAETEGGVAWAQAGGDFDSNRAASVDESAGEPAGWDSFDITALVESWAAGDLPSLGVMLKSHQEGAAGSVSYATDDNTSSPELRPKLSITYADASSSTGPVVEVTFPRPGDMLRGSVQLAAAASDDRRVDKVEFLLDGSVVGQDTTAPFELTWNSTSVSNGSHSFTVRGTDDVGNATTSSAVTAQVGNSALPSVEVTSPSTGAVVLGDVALEADASDDGTVERVQFLVDGLRVGEDLDSPYEATWATLDPKLPFYDGPHVVTALAYDDHGQTKTSDPVGVVVANASGTKYRASFTTTAVPGVVTYDPLATVQQFYGATVTITNISGQNWNTANLGLRYRWFAPDSPSIVPGIDSSAGVTTSATSFPLGAAVVLDGTSVQVPVLFQPPALPPGTARGSYRLQFDLYEQNGISTGTWFAERGNQPSDNSVVVSNTLMASALGVEHYYHYRTQEVGAGMTHLMNVANGNSLLQWTPWSSRGRGLSTVLNLTYNSLEDRGGSLAGNNWSLSLSSLIRLGTPLDIHPNAADQSAGNSNRWIEFIDGDGTTHRFEGKQTTTGTVFWEEPAGVHLYLRQYSTTDPTRKWALSRPDRVTFFFDDKGYPTSVQDGNGNTLTFTLEDVPSAEDPGGVSKRITKVTDATGQEYFTISYFSKDEAQKPQIRGKVKTITDQSGSKMNFFYYEDGNLLRITQVGGTTPEGVTTPDRSFVFTYTTSSGSGPALTPAAARENPDPRTSPQSSRLYSVRDPRGIETTFAHETNTPKKWRLKSSIDRIGAQTNYVYDLDTRLTTVTNPVGETIARSYIYGYDTEGKVTSIKNPRNEVTSIEWTNRHVTKVTEPSLVETRFAYNDNGYITDRWDQLGNRTTLEYQNDVVDANDTSGKWKTGRTIPHYSQLIKRIDPKGTATTSISGDFEWRFFYNDKGNLVQTIDPTGATTMYDVDSANGNIRSIRDPKGNYTYLQNYDDNGCPTRVVEPGDTITQLVCDKDGLLRSIQDPMHAGYTGGSPRNYRTFFDYDEFHRLARQSTPKSTEFDSGKLIWTGTEYDKNDNVVATIGPHYGNQYTPSLGSRSETTYDAMDRPTLMKGPDNSGDSAGERTGLEYDKLGRVTKATLPSGTKTTATADDFATVYAYDSLDRIVTETAYDASGTVNAATRYTHYCYDDPKGDLKWVVAPLGHSTFTSCGQAVPPDYTTKYGYDVAHRVSSVKDGLDQVETFDYDANGNIKTYTNQNGDPESREYDQRNALVKVIEPFEGARKVTTVSKYDPNGNLTQLISPRAWDASTDKQTFTQYATQYEYDGLNRLTRVLLPTSNAKPQQQYIHNEYDKNGNLLKTSLPTTESSSSNAEWKTVMTYFDPGWIRSSNDPGPIPQVDFDYFAEGWQASRKPKQSAQEPTRPVTTTYFPDGMVKTVSDRAGMTSTYAYDANNNLKSAERVGTSGPSTTDIVAEYDGFDQLTKLLQRRGKTGNWTASTYAYDANGNVKVREDDRTATSLTAEPSSGRRHTFNYDKADWVFEQFDDYATPDASDDRKITTQFTPTGWEKQRVIAKSNGSGGWNPKQTTNWVYFANGKLKTLNTTTPSQGPIESHTIDYIDSSGIYVNGNRVKDTFSLKGQNGQCNASNCVATYAYDPRDRLVTYGDGQSPSTTTEYGLDTVGNVVTETVNNSVRRFRYSADRLVSERNAADTTDLTRYWYDPYGNLDCVTNGSGAQTNCSPSDQATPSSNLMADYAFDPLDRLMSYRKFNNTSKTESASYVYDALDRVTTEKEDEGMPAARTTNFTYLGLSSLVTTEDRTGNGYLDKSYGYDAYGNRITMTNTTGSGSEEYTYGYDTHGSVSALVKTDGTVKATYGYAAYGAADGDVTQGDPPDASALNPYRYSARRLDPGSDSYDMGARRYSADPGRFLQQDVFMGAVSDLGLTLDPLTQNRYALAGANPISFVEWDGHMPAADGTGNGSKGPNPFRTGFPGGDPFLDGRARQNRSCIIHGYGCAGTQGREQAEEAGLRAAVAALISAQVQAMEELLKAGEKVGPRLLTRLGSVLASLPAAAEGCREALEAGGGVGDCAARGGTDFAGSFGGCAAGAALGSKLPGGGAVRAVGGALGCGFGAVLGEAGVNEVREFVGFWLDPGEIHPSSLTRAEKNRVALRVYRDPLYGWRPPKDPRDLYIFGPVPGFSEEYLRRTA